LTLEVLINVLKQFTPWVSKFFGPPKAHKLGIILQKNVVVCLLNYIV